tara:strand:+ start:486 stop:944 length:459 start_codon:yes stop_codon:yes gene_type:complete
MDNNHIKFLEHLDESKNAVFKCAEYFYKKGIPVEIQPMQKAKRHKDWKDHTDDGDLLISQRIEVKNVSADFTSENDWKFGNKFIVCAKHSWDMAQLKPYAYMIVNKNKTHVAIVYGKTKKHWFVEERTDKRYDNVKQEFYFCPLDKIIWIEL